MTGRETCQRVFDGLKAAGLTGNSQYRVYVQGAEMERDR